MINILTILGLLFVYFLINVFIFNYLKNYKRFFLFIFIYLLFCLLVFLILNFNYIYLYLIFIFFALISFKFFSFLFFEKSPTIFLCEIVDNNENFQDIKNNFLSNIFIEKYIKNLILSKLIIENENYLKLSDKGRYFYLFFKRFFTILFR
jgi:hypothetical protein